MFTEVSDLLAVINLIKPNFGTSSSSSLRYFGLMTLRYKKLPTTEAQFLYFFDSLVHEAAHMYLNLIMTHDPILLNAQGEFYSPARNTLRPLKGVLHAHFVFYKLVMTYRLVEKFFNRKGKKKNSGIDYLNLNIAQLPYDFYERLAAYEQKFQQGQQIIRKEARFTEIGEKLFQNVAIQ